MKTLGSLVWLWLGIWAITGCDSKTTVVDPCGDGVVDPGEDCDSDVGDQSCTSLGHYNATGVLRCTRDCDWDTSSCGGRCGDNAVDAADGEQCDGDNLNGQSCQTQGYAGGNLACDGGCRFVVTGCSSVCGNGIREVGETCDDGNTAADDGCAPGCAIETGWTCDEASPNVCTPICGDLAANGPEACDGADLRGQTCEGLFYHGGQLACADDCTYDVTACAAVGRCGDGTLHDGFGEECDGSELGGQTCEGLGYYGGQLACANDCRFDVTACAVVGRCGDGVLQDAFGEVCDGSALGGETCEGLGYYGGTLFCELNCGGYELTSCIAAGRCGDGVIQSSEICDGITILTGYSCVSQGYYGGELACAATCQELIYDDCAAVGRCGDGVIQATHGEECDGTEFGGNTCQTEDFYTGFLACDNCRLNTANCRGRCGDDELQLGAEACEPSVFDPAQTCSSLFNLHFGTPVCATDCEYTTGTCSNGRVFAATGFTAQVRVTDLEVDAARSFYLVGSFTGTLFGDTTVLQKAFLLKLNPDGTLAWIRTRSGSGGGLAQANALRLTGSKVFVTGWAVEGAAPDVFLWSMSTDGTGEAYSTWGSTGEDAGQDLFVLPSGGDFQVWVTGYASGVVGGVGGYGGRDIFLSRFEPGMAQPAETRVWGTGGDDEATGIGYHAPSGSILLVGTTSGSLNGQTVLGGTDQFLIKYLTDGSQVVTTLFGSALSDTSTRVALDGAGFAYVTGAQEESSGTQNITLTKLDPVEGVVAWRRSWGGSSSGFGADVVVGSDGLVRVTGTVTGNLLSQLAIGGMDAFVLSCTNADCTTASAVLFGTAGTDQAFALVQAATGHFFAAGTTTGALDGQYGGPDLAGFLYRVLP